MSAIMNKISLAIITLAVWQLISYWFCVPEYLVPSPYSITNNLLENHEYLMHHSTISIIEIILGLCCGSTVAIAMAITLDYNITLKKIMMPYMIVMKNIPIFVLAPLTMIYIGHGTTSKITLITISCYFPMALGIMQGLEQTPMHARQLLDSIKRCNHWKSLIFIRMPYAVPLWLSGCKLAWIHAPFSVVACDWIGSSEGLGYALMLAYGRLDLPMIFSCLAILLFISITFYKIISCIETKILEKLQLNRI
jgi:putative hydroxymethylpyrimidine transport system permease protein